MKTIEPSFYKHCPFCFGSSDDGVCVVTVEWPVANFTWCFDSLMFPTED